MIKRPLNHSALSAGLDTNHYSRSWNIASIDFQIILSSDFLTFLLFLASHLLDLWMWSVAGSILDPLLSLQYSLGKLTWSHDLKYHLLHFYLHCLFWTPDSYIYQLWNTFHRCLKHMQNQTQVVSPTCFPIISPISVNGNSVLPGDQTKSLKIISLLLFLCHFTMNPLIIQKTYPESNHFPNKLVTTFVQDTAMTWLGWCYRLLMVLSASSLDPYSIFSIQH